MLSGVIFAPRRHIHSFHYFTLHNCEVGRPGDGHAAEENPETKVDSGGSDAVFEHLPAALLAQAHDCGDDERTETSQQRPGERILEGQRAVLTSDIRPRAKSTQSRNQVKHKVSRRHHSEVRFGIRRLLQALLTVGLLVIRLFERLTKCAEPDIEKCGPKAGIVVLKIAVVNVVVLR